MWVGWGFLVTQIFGVDKEDLKGLNIALDSKQQELELLKRRMGVRGTAGLKPASKIPRRRDSAVFKTRSNWLARAVSVRARVPGPRKGPSSVPPLVTCRICLDDVVSRAVVLEGEGESALSDGKCTRESGTDGLYPEVPHK
ncbi:hypothetical protein B0H14DRAFT_2572434 [Mycena olivaceomarginata]|nr:hypothetical protein B0H14DRAFT_2572434 [Mycena olivaceomarginata]